METRLSRCDASWITPYLRVLEITRVKDSRRPGYIRWVERYVQFLEEKPLPASSRRDIEAFMASLRSEAGVEEWKIKTAGDALRLLHTAVHGKKRDGAVGVPGGTASSELDPLRAVCRARGYSRKT